ncbi:MAG: rRNA maturation RNase YbeY [Pseudomonadota bacterium]
MIKTQIQSAMVDLDLRVAEPEWDKSLPDLEAICRRALDAGAAQKATQGEVAILLTNNTEIQDLNRDWRGKDKPTDVLSFPADPMDKPFLGDIAVAIGVTQDDAETRGIGLDQHLSHLLIHGLLHLLGHDHKDDTEAAEMEALEIAALASLGWPDPYS